MQTWDSNLAWLQVQASKQASKQASNGGQLSGQRNLNSLHPLQHKIAPLPNYTPQRPFSHSTPPPAHFSPPTPPPPPSGPHPSVSGCTTALTWL